MAKRRFETAHFTFLPGIFGIWTEAVKAAPRGALVPALTGDQQVFDIVTRLELSEEACQAIGDLLAHNVQRQEQSDIGLNVT